MADEGLQMKDAAAEAVPSPQQDMPEPQPVRRGKPVTANFNDQIEIYCDKPLPLYDIGEVRAYEAEGRSTVSGSLIAYVCERYLTPRLRVIPTYKSMINPGIATLAANGVVYWPPAGQERYVLFYSRNLGEPLLRPGAKPALDWKQERVVESVLKPLVAVLHDFRARDFAHGAIRPSNMYNGGTEEFEKVILGECLSGPPGYAQPVLYEPINRAMASPVGRTRCTQADDLYALGVSLAVLMRARDPLAGLSDEDVIRHKIEMGSYAAVTGKDRFTGSVLELLRGLLNDDATQRWNIEEVMAWLDGRRLSPKQAAKNKRAARPITLGGEKYFLQPFLAMDLEKHPVEAAHLIEDGALEQWMTRSLEDKELVEKLDQVVQNARESGRGPGYQERLLSNISFLLDPQAPIRYRGLKLFGDGVGHTLTQAMVKGEDLRPLNDLLMQGIALNWAMMQEGASADAATMISQFDTCRSFVRQNKIGYGLERCLYYLNPEAPCLSEKLAKYQVNSPEDMMNAFEDICQKGMMTSLFLDRHSVAFLSVKDRKVVDSYLYDLNTEEDHRRILANLKCLATIQKRSALGAYPGIAKVFVGMLPVVYDRYHDNAIREKLKSNIERYAADGDLVKMAGLLDNAEIANKDMAAFKSAMQEYMNLAQEYKALDVRLVDRKNFGKRTGQDVSAIVSSVIASAIILAVAFMFMTDQSMF